MNKCYIKARSGPPDLEHDSDSSSEEDESFLPFFNKAVIVSQPRNIPRLVSIITIHKYKQSFVFCLNSPESLTSYLVFNKYGVNDTISCQKT